MTFVQRAKGEWELTRFATDITKHSIGVGGKMFNYFIRNYNPLLVKSFADRRWTSCIGDNLYLKLGFKLDKILKPDYRYFLDGIKNRIHKFNFRKQTLHKKYGLPLDLTESQMVERINAKKVYDCGLLKYVWKKTES